MKPIDKQSRIPYYYQLADILREYIQTSPDDVTSLPSENDLVQSQQVSRATVRQALALLEREGLVISAVCRSGECSACRTKLISGKVFAPARVHLKWADEKSNYIHPCMSYPVEDLRIRI